MNERISDAIREHLTMQDQDSVSTKAMLVHMAKRSASGEIESEHPVRAWAREYLRQLSLFSAMTAQASKPPTTAGAVSWFKDFSPAV